MSSSHWVMEDGVKCFFLCDIIVDLETNDFGQKSQGYGLSPV